MCANHKSCTDTISLGYVFIGGGGGIWYDFASHFAFILDVNLLGAIGTGDRQSGFNIDVQAGLGVALPVGERRYGQPGTLLPSEA